MMELNSLSAEHGVIGAMLIQPHLIDVITDDLSADAFDWPENADLYRLIMTLHDEGQPIDVVTLSDRRAMLSNEQKTIAYAGEIQANTPSVANAKAWVRIVKERAVARQIASASAQMLDIAHEQASIEDKVAQVQALALALDSQGSEGECQLIGDILTAHVDILEARHERTLKGDLMDGLSTGLPELDKFTQGLKDGQMIVIGGRPAMGKTTLAMNIAADVGITQGKPVLVISLEMSKAQLLDRLLAAIGGIPLPAIKDGSCTHKYSTELFAAAAKLRDAPIAVTDVPVMTMPRVRAISRRQKHKMGGMGLVVLDYLGLVEGDGNGRVEDVTAMSRQIKLLARELGCPVIVLCQLNRGCESRPDKRPVLSDLRESGAIEQDADIVMFVYRDEVYHPNSDKKGIGEVLIRKNRDGEVGSVFTAFQGERSRFVPLAASDFNRPKATEKADW